MFPSTLVTLTRRWSYLGAGIDGTDADCKVEDGVPIQANEHAEWLVKQKLVHMSIRDIQ